jgi:hypothetical protein
VSRRRDSRRDGTAKAALRPTADISAIQAAPAEIGLRWCGLLVRRFWGARTYYELAGKFGVYP